MGAVGKDKEKDGKNTTGKRKPGRIPTSCCECRRLKLRCDKQVPCGKCVSRGCAAICPDGSLTAGKGNRLVLANTEQLHDRIEILCSRIRELENALRHAQTQLSDEEHPLLRSDLLQLKAPHSLPTSNTGSAPSKTVTPTITEDRSPNVLTDMANLPRKPEDENLLDAFGTLSIRENGETQFLGQTARSEYLIRALAKPQNLSLSTLGMRLSSKIINGVFRCPSDNCESSSEQDTDEVGKEIWSLLPPLSEAIRLCELYLEHGKYMYTPLQRTELFDEVLGCIYRTGSFDAAGCYQTLALLFIVFGLASLFDPELPSCSVQAQEYFYLSRAAYGTASPLSQTTLHAIWCMVHLAQFLEFSDWEALGSTAAWIIVGHAVRMGSSIGLHLNCSRWNLPEDFQQKRYRLFWTIFATDTWSSFHYGRPPSISRPYIDCPLPKDTEEPVSEDEGRGSGFHYWTWQYTSFMHAIMEVTFGSSRPAYSAIIDFDRKIRDYPVPENLVLRCKQPSQPDVYMQRLIVLSLKENTLMHLHRAYFAQALQDSPNDLSKHKFIVSVVVTFRSAWRLSKALKHAWQSMPQLISRYHLIWSQVLTAAIVLCILVTRAPNSNMTKASVEELDEMAILFEEAAPTSRSANNILDTIRSLRRKAREASTFTSSPEEFTHSNDGSPSDSSSSGGSSDTRSSPCSFTNTLEIDETQDLPLSTGELDRLVGRSHLIAACRKVLSGDQSASPNSVPSSGSSPDLGYKNYTPSDIPSSSLAVTLAQEPHPQIPPPTSSSGDLRDLTASSFQQSPFAAQNLHPSIAQDIHNIEMGGPALSLFDAPSDFDIMQSFGTSGSQFSASSSFPVQDENSSQSQFTSFPFSDVSMGGMDDMNVQFHSMGDMSTLGGGGSSGGTFGSNTPAGYSYGQNQANAQLPLPFGAPILDATWQSFVEQLGF